MKPSVYKRTSNKTRAVPTALTLARVEECKKSLGLLGIALEEAENKPKLIEVDKATECHITPDSVARRMVDYLCIKSGDDVLEPEGGTGSLVNAVIDSGVDCSITVVEKHIGLFNGLCERFSGLKGVVNCVNSCFLDYSKQNDKGNYSKIIMNPPFKQTKKHIEAAFNMLDENGELIALVPITFNHEKAETIEVLPNDTFAGIKVNTKIILMEA